MREQSHEARNVDVNRNVFQKGRTRSVPLCLATRLVAMHEVAMHRENAGLSCGKARGNAWSGNVSKVFEKTMATNAPTRRIVFTR